MHPNEIDMFCKLGMLQPYVPGFSRADRRINLGLHPIEVGDHLFRGAVITQDCLVTDDDAHDGG